jgi:hypothetical protein
MKRILHKAKNHRAAAKWDVLQQVRMTPHERQAIAKELKKRFFGRTVPDVRDKRD